MGARHAAKREQQAKASSLALVVQASRGEGREMKIENSAAVAAVAAAATTTAVVSGALVRWARASALSRVGPLGCRLR